MIDISFIIKQQFIQNIKFKNKYERRTQHQSSSNHSHLHHLTRRNHQPNRTASLTQIIHAFTGQSHNRTTQSTTKAQKNHTHQSPLRNAQKRSPQKKTQPTQVKTQSAYPKQYPNVSQNQFANQPLPTRPTSAHQQTQRKPHQYSQQSSNYQPHRRPKKFQSQVPISTAPLEMLGTEEQHQKRKRITIKNIKHSRFKQ